MGVVGFFESVVVVVMVNWPVAWAYLRKCKRTSCGRRKIGGVMGAAELGSLLVMSLLRGREIE